MRSAFILVPLVALTTWLRPVAVLAELEGDKPRSSPTTPTPDAAGWPLLLADKSFDDAERELLGQLRPFLDPTDFLALEPRQKNVLLRYAESRLQARPRLARCWSPDTPDHVLSAYHAVDEAAQSASRSAPRKANQFFARWGRTATDGFGQNEQGRPITLTWSIVPDGTPIPGDPAIGDEAGPSDLRARLAELYGGDTGPPENQPWFHLFEEIFDQLSAQSGITYVYEERDDGKHLGTEFPGRLGDRGDVRLSGHPIDGNGSTLAYNYFPDNGDMVIDTNDNWFANTDNNSIRLVNTIAHEHGHGIGLQHVCPIDQTKLLEPFIPTNFRGIQFDEIYTLQRWYGDPLEQHASYRDNDTPARATPLDLEHATPFVFQWLSIDDNSDTDCYVVTPGEGARLSARVIPSSQSYREGGIEGRSCGEGTLFDSSSIHDLTLELLDRDSTVLARSDENAAGQPEAITLFPVPDGGRYILRVRGGDANRAQLYRLEVDIHPPEANILPTGTTIVTESHAPRNGLIEPGETVEVEIELTNEGPLDGQNVRATLSGPQGFTGFSTEHEYGLISPGHSGSRRFTFALEGECGRHFPLRLSVSADGGIENSYPLPMDIGRVTRPLAERFDLSDDPTPPPGWSSLATSAGEPWKLSSLHPDSPPYSAFGRTMDRLGTSSLVSPSFIYGPEGARLRFRHSFVTEASTLDPNLGFDGGVLEISIDDAPWQDIIVAGGSFVEGGYNRTLSSEFQNPLPNRQSWSGTSEGWMSTVIDLPGAPDSRSVRLRWLLGHDTSVAEHGWWLDNIEVKVATCDQTLPVIHLTLEDDRASEWAPRDLALLSVATDLPLAADFPIPLLVEGTANPRQDITGLEEVILAAGETKRRLEVRGVTDQEVEGDEFLRIAIDPAFARPADPAFVRITITDTPYGAWAASQFGLLSPNRPEDDFDGDGCRNLEEYAWQTDATSARSQPAPNFRTREGFLYGDFPFATLPSDLTVRAQISTDLRNWTSAGVEVLSEGFRVPVDGSKHRFLRYFFEQILAP